MVRRRTAVLLVACLVAGTAHAGTANGRLAREVMTPDQAMQQWHPVTPPTPAPWPASVDRSLGPACVNLGFRIGADGRTGDFRILRRWSAAGDGDAAARRHLDDFARSAAAAVGSWRFAPAVPHAGPVYTAANLAFGRGGDVAATRARCAVDDLPRFVSAAQRRADARGNLLQSRQDGKRVADPPMIPYIKHDWFDGAIGPTAPR